MNIIEDFKNIAIVEKGWYIKDIIFIVIFYLVIGNLLNLFLSQFLFFHYEINIYFSISIASISAIYILEKKYPLQLLPVTNIKNILKYSIPAFFICFTIYSPFYHNIWFGALLETPKQYKYYLEFNGIEKVIFIIDFCLIGPATEEILCRGFFYRIIRNKNNIFWGAVISTTIFYLFHGLGPFNVNIILVSLVFTYVYEKSGNIWASIITHSLNNILWCILVFGGISANL